MSEGEGRILTGETEKAGRDMDAEDFSEHLGSTLAAGLLRIPHIRRFANAMRKVNGINPERTAKSFRKKFLEGL